MWSLWLVRQKGTLFLSVVLDPNSQPSSHDYYHHQDLTLSTFVLANLYSVHTVYSVQIVLVLDVAHVLFNSVAIFFLYGIAQQVVMLINVILFII